MKKKLSELTTLERHWVLAEVLGYTAKVFEVRGGFDVTGHYILYTKDGTIPSIGEDYQDDIGKYWSPDTDKELMWDLMIELFIADDGCGVIEAPKNPTPLDIAICNQLAYIYHKLGTDTVEVPEGLE